MRRVNLDAGNAAWAGNRNVTAVWAFGSGKHGELREGSDLDVGVLFGTPPTLDSLADLRAALQQTLHFDEIDLVPLNDASPILRFEAVTGVLLYCRDDERMAGFVSLTAREYEDGIGMIEKAMALRK